MKPLVIGSGGREHALAWRLTFDEPEAKRSPISSTETGDMPNNLKSQFVISSWGGRRYAPYAFTEQGIAMLSSVLRSPRAIQVNIEIMRAFVRLRRILSEHKELSRRLDELEDRYDEQFRSVFEAIRRLMAPPEPAARNPIGFTAKIPIKDKTP
jgi:hypothetical protein